MGFKRKKGDKDRRKRKRRNKRGLTVGRNNPVGRRRY